MRHAVPRYDRFLAVLALGVSGLVSSAAARAAPSSGGVIAYDDSQRLRPAIATVNADGTGRRILVADAVDPAWSPDGRWLTYTRRRGIWRCRPDGTGRRRIVDIRARHESVPALSPDGRRVAFAMDWEVRRDEPADSEVRSAIYVARRNGSRIRRISPIYEGGPWGWPAWSPDGRVIAFQANGTGSGLGIALARPDGEGYRVLRHGIHAQYLKFAPVGRRLLFLDRGDPEPPRVTTWNLRTHKLRTISAAELGSGFTWNVTWTPDGRRIAYSHQAWTPAAGIVWGAPMELFTIRPDGTRVRRIMQLPGSWGDALTWRAP